MSWDVKWRHTRFTNASTTIVAYATKLCHQCNVCVFVKRTWRCSCMCRYHEGNKVLWLDRKLHQRHVEFCAKKTRKANLKTQDVCKVYVAQRRHQTRSNIKQRHVVQTIFPFLSFDCCSADEPVDENWKGWLNWQSLDCYPTNITTFRSVHAFIIRCLQALDKRRKNDSEYFIRRLM